MNLFSEKNQYEWKSVDTNNYYERTDDECENAAAWQKPTRVAYLTKRIGYN